MTTNNFYEGCSKMATIFLMVLMEKKKLAPEVIVNSCTKTNTVQDFKIYSAE